MKPEYPASTMMTGGKGHKQDPLPLRRISQHRAAHPKQGEVAAKAHGNQPGAVKRIPSKKQVQRFINTARLMKAGMEY